MSIESMLAAVLVLAVVILIHELGHFLVAKWCDVEIRTFSMGFGPTIWTRKIGETDYRVALIPFGGYVRMAGSEEDGADPEDAPSDPARGFTAKSLSQRAAVVLAGPLVNIVFAVLLLTLSAWLYGIPVASDSNTVAGVGPDSPAAAAGLSEGDRIVSIDGDPVTDWQGIVDKVLASGGRSQRVEIVTAAGDSKTVDLVPALVPRMDHFGEQTASVYQIGIQRMVDLKPAGPLEALFVGAVSTWEMSSMIVETVSRLVQGRVSAGDLGGPILIAREAGRQAQEGLQPLLVFMALISVNLGVMNLLPIPVLDGGHLAFMAFEGLRGRPLSLRVREFALSFGMVLIGSLMIFVVFNDIFRIVAG